MCKTLTHPGSWPLFPHIVDHECCCPEVQNGVKKEQKVEQKLTRK